MADLSDRAKLFEELLPEWENIIASLAYRLLHTRAIDRGLLEAEDIRNILRLKLWQAIEKYDESRGTKLDSWITGLLRQECSLLTQAHYNKQNRGPDGRVLLHIPLTGTLEDNEGEALDIEDPGALYAFDAVAELEWFRLHTELIFKVLQTKPSLDEKRVFEMLLSGQYESDREIADELEVNFAKVGEVRFKAKLVLAIMEQIPLSTVTKAKNVERVAHRLRAALSKHVEGLPTIVM